MFKLANGKEIDIEEVMNAMEDSDLTHHYFLDAETGKVEFIFEDVEEDWEERLEEIDLERYEMIPQLPSYEKYNWMVSFVEKVVSFEMPDWVDRFSIALDGKGAFGRFKRVLHEAGEGLPGVWAQWERDHLYEAMQDWFESLGIGITEDFYFDNCPICEAMRKAEEEGRSLSKTELKKVFKQAGEDGHHVEGEMLTGGSEDAENYN